MQEAEAQILFLRQRLAEHEFDVAQFYYRKEAYQAAIRRLLNLIQVYPDMSDVDGAFYMLADSYRREENYVKAARVFRTLVDRFPCQRLRVPRYGAVAQPPRHRHLARYRTAPSP